MLTQLIVGALPSVILAHQTAVPHAHPHGAGYTAGLIAAGLMLAALLVAAVRMLQHAKPASHEDQ